MYIYIHMYRCIDVYMYRCMHVLYICIIFVMRMVGTDGVPRPRFSQWSDFGSCDPVTLQRRTEHPTGTWPVQWWFTPQKW